MPRRSRARINALVIEYEHLPGLIARKWFAHTTCEADRDDLVSEATIGLIDAATRFRASKGAFKPYAERRIAGAVRDYLRREDPLSRDMRSYRKDVDAALDRLSQKFGRRATNEEAAEALGVTDEEYEAIRQKSHRPEFVEYDKPADGHRRSPKETIPDQARPVDAVVGARLDVEEALCGLDERLRYVVEQRFFGGVGLGEIGADLQVTESRACQLVSAGLRAMREALSE